MTQLTVSEEIAAWRAVTTDPEAIGQLPVAIVAPAVIHDGLIIRLAVSREHASKFFDTGLFGDLDVLIMSATMRNDASRDQVPVDPAVMLGYIDRLTSPEAARASFDRTASMSAGLTMYRLLLINADHEPVPVSLLQAAYLSKNG